MHHPCQIEKYNEIGDLTFNFHYNLQTNVKNKLQIQFLQSFSINAHAISWHNSTIQIKM